MTEQQEDLVRNIIAMTRGWSRYIYYSVNRRETYKEIRDFKKADEIRDNLQAMGIELEDTKTGVRVKSHWGFNTSPQGFTDVEKQYEEEN
jgi:cysteinyl-tRNA synthetase